MSIRAGYQEINEAKKNVLTYNCLRVSTLAYEM
jgi:hypothetical protein